MLDIRNVLSVPTMWNKNKIDKWTNKVFKCLFESIITHLAQPEYANISRK